MKKYDEMERDHDWDCLWGYTGWYHRGLIGGTIATLPRVGSNGLVPGVCKGTMCTMTLEMFALRGRGPKSNG